MNFTFSDPVIQSSVLRGQIWDINPVTGETDLSSGRGPYSPPRKSIVQPASPIRSITATPIQTVPIISPPRSRAISPPRSPSIRSPRSRAISPPRLSLTPSIPVSSIPVSPPTIAPSDAYTADFRKNMETSNNLSIALQRDMSQRNIEEFRGDDIVPITEATLNREIGRSPENFLRLELQTFIQFYRELHIINHLFRICGMKKRMKL